ncbi:hypothetical protein FM107_18325 [Sphingobacterium sp. JB170]|nr:hypothetical protein FM107_18325 [Sphingobacterium sp. JB170]
MIPQSYYTKNAVNIGFISPSRMMRKKKNDQLMSSHDRSKYSFPEEAFLK